MRATVGGPALLLACLWSLSAQSRQFNYAEALQKSILFYEAQRSGRLPADNRLNWRADSGLQDGSDRGVDLTGGWYDAGDHVKFGFPMASSATLLAWGAFEYRTAFTESRQKGPMLASLRWVSDYFLKASVVENELWGQVGDGQVDHSWWGSAEVMNMARPAYRITKDCPGSDLAGETAAALASASMVFKAEGELAYADTLLQRAISLYRFAEDFPGKYSDCIANASAFYRSTNGYVDELAWAATWLYRATGSNDYLSKALRHYENLQRESGTPYKSFTWTHNWDDKSYGTHVLLAKLTGSPESRANAEHWLDYWTTGFEGRRIRYTPGGLAWLDQWGALRYSANTAFLAFIYSDWLRANNLDSERVVRYTTFAERQINYMLGDNPQQSSYVIGFGVNPPKNPHHRTAHGSWSDNINLPAASAHTLFGALVGGPDSSDRYTDSRSDFVQNEVATDYNAAFTGALARMFQQYGGTPLADFPPPETPSRDEFFVEASINQEGTNFIEVAAYANNQTAWPARVTKEASIRYFFRLESDDTTGISLTTAFNECSAPTGPLRWSERVYYIEIPCGDLSPAGSRLYRKLTQFRITSATPRSASQDWSISGLTFPASSVVKTSRIVLYSGSTRLWGEEPPRGPVALGVITQPALPRSTVGKPYSVLLKAEGGTLPYAKWEVSNGKLPGGLTLDGAVGLISGVPESAGTTRFSVRVTDALLGTAERELTLTTDQPDPLIITSRALRTAYVGQNYSANLEASGGIEPYSWSVIEGSLPSGISLSGNVLTGTPSDVAEALFTVQVTDRLGSTSRKVFVLSIQTQSAAAADLRLHYRSNFSEPVSNQVGPQFKIVNAGNTAVPLSELTIRYYFTLESPQPLNSWCDYAAIDCANVITKFIDQGEARFYLENSFTAAAGSVPGAGDSGEIQNRFAKADWSNFDQTNDYSFDATKKSFVPWERVTLYRNGVLLFGTEPSN